MVSPAPRGAETGLPAGWRESASYTESATSVVFSQLHTELGRRGVDEWTMRAWLAGACRPLRIRRLCLTVAGQRDGQVANPLKKVEGPEPAQPVG